ncbi:tyrosine-type recombinase/integrase [Cupriavidus sp. CuC1]|uniref:tyrosine-type recombinase/integrase n=1 Tax=Cupriavidus sp. CuC1 TaxID=3373131 RepID=UPI0037D53B2D
MMPGAHVSCFAEAKSEVVRVWCENRYLTPASARQYLQWVRRFYDYCGRKALDAELQLTHAGAMAFARWYARRRHTDAGSARHNAHCALRAWAFALRSMDHDLPVWESVSRRQEVQPPLLQEFAEYLRQHRGNPAMTVKKKIAHTTSFLAYLRHRHRHLRHLKLSDIDAFLVGCREHYARTTTADIGCSLRSFLRFLRVTGRLPVDLASSVVGPMVRRDERPPRALPWVDVLRILAAVDSTTAKGQRDYTMLLLMSTYGLGAGEVTRLTLDDIDWHTLTLHVVRPKTGVEFLLPLLPAVACAVARYLQDGRPRHTPTRHLFISTKAPHLPLGCSSAVRYILVTHAHSAGVWAEYLGSHVLRHTHACRQMELGVVPKVLGDILGHRNADSVSAYVRIATEGLRQLALPVPR